ncbi:unnamed protein product, partial [Rhizoctonia solani]
PETDPEPEREVEPEEELPAEEESQSQSQSQSLPVPPKSKRPKMRPRPDPTPEPQPEHEQGGEPEGELKTGESAPQVKNSGPKRQNSARLAKNKSKHHPTHTPDGLRIKSATPMLVTREGLRPRK